MKYQLSLIDGELVLSFVKNGQEDKNLFAFVSCHPTTAVIILLFN